jgi:hypothetical protein
MDNLIAADLTLEDLDALPGSPVMDEFKESSDTDYFRFNSAIHS